MKKIFFLLICILCASSVLAQRVSKKESENHTLLNQIKTQGIDTITEHFTGEPMLYASSGGGYIGGTNEYGDLQKMQKFTIGYDCAVPQILLWFGHAEGTGNFKACIWADNSGIPGTALETVTIPVSSIDTNGFTPVIFSVPFYVSAGTSFWAGIDLTYCQGSDTIALYTSEDGTYPNAITNTFEQWSDQTYHSFTEAWNLDIALGIFPVVWDTTVINLIKGNIFLDTDNDGVQDVSENGIPYQLLKAGPYYGYTDMDGSYGIVTSSGSYWVKPLLQGYLTTTPDSISVNFSGFGQVSTGNNFACQPIPGIRDLSISLLEGAFRPGFDAEYFIYIKNEGTQIESAQVTLNYDSRLGYLSSFPTEDSTTGNSVFWNFTMSPGTETYIYVNMHTPDSLGIGTILSASTSIEPIADDTVPSNNFCNLEHEVTGSYDPNDKSVFPAGEGPEGYIGLNPIMLEYTIRFQNTGTDTAFTIVIKDSLSDNVDLSTFKKLCSSHPVSISLTNSKEMNFTFSNILLPDSNVDQLGSNGFVKYSVGVKPGLLIGTEILNTAYIYFDYNPAVVTNTTINTIGNPVDVSEIIINSELSGIYPNPFVKTATIEISSSVKIENACLKIYDILGNIVYSRAGISRNKIVIDMGNNKGLYFYSVIEKERVVASGKFIAE